MCGLSRELLAKIPQATRMQTSWVDFLHWTPSCLPLVSGVRCWLPLSVVPRQLSLLSRRQLPSSGSVVNCLFAVQRQLLSAPFSSQLSFAFPYHFRIWRDFMSKNPLSCFAQKQTKESSALAAHPHSATFVPNGINAKKKRQSRRGFQFGSSIPFPSTITVKLSKYMYARVCVRA